MQIVLVGLCSTCIYNNYYICVNLYHVSAQDVDERMINVYYYYIIITSINIISITIINSVHKT